MTDTIITLPVPVIPTPLNLTDAATLALLPGFDLTAYDADMITLAIRAATEQISKYCDRVFDRAAYTESLDGNGRDELWLSQWPIVSVSSVVADGTTLTVTTDYSVLDRGLYRESLWDIGRRTVVVTYQAGYVSLTDVPSDLKMIATRLAADLLRMGGRSGDVASAKLGNWQETYRENAAAIDAYKTDLAPHRRPRL
jgi:hypothetical protein